MSLQETIRRILKEELYSPGGTEMVPNKFVIHKSSPVWRKNIKLMGLQTSVGECYQSHVGDVECQPAIFATDSLKKEDMFDDGYETQNVPELLGIETHILKMEVMNNI
jgi:hypothetical protein